MQRAPGKPIPVIGIVGPMGGGKSTLAKHLIEKHGFTRMSMAGPLKDMLLALGLSEEDVNGPQAHRAQPSTFLCGRSPRHALQTIGTEWGRRLIGPDIWVNAVQERIIRHQMGKKRSAGVVIDDIRFPNEWEMVHRLGGHVWRVRRPEVERRRTWFDHLLHWLPYTITRVAQLFGYRPIHESEWHWPDAPADAEFSNTGTEADLRRTATQHLGLLEQ